MPDDSNTTIPNAQAQLGSASATNVTTNGDLTASAAASLPPQAVNTGVSLNQPIPASTVVANPAAPQTADVGVAGNIPNAPAPINATAPAASTAPAQPIKAAPVQNPHGLLHDFLARFHLLIADLHQLEAKGAYEVSHIEAVIKKYV